MHSFDRDLKVVQTPWLKFAVLAIAGIALRLAVSTRGHNFDMESWDIVARLVQGGKSVYAHTYRYPYGPAGAYALGALRSLAEACGLHGIQGFHLVLAGFLSLVDVLIAYMVLRIAGVAGAAMFLLNPVSILISGFHSQLETVAIAAALASWLLLRRATALYSTRLFYLSAALLGASLAVKHVFIFFPLWILMARGECKWKPLPRAFYVGIAYGAFLLSFGLYFLIYPESVNGILRNVFLYRGDNAHIGNSLVPRILSKLGYLAGAKESIENGPLRGVLTPLWILLLTALGWLSRRNWSRLPYLYLTGLLLFTSTMADQYMVDVVVVIAIFWYWWPGWIYTAVATVCLVFSRYNIGSVHGLPQMIHGTPWHRLNDWLYPQLVLILLLWKLMSASDTSRPGAPSRLVQTAMMVLPGR